MKGPLLAVGLLVVALGAAKTSGAQQPWDHIPLLNIYQLAYPVEWNGKTIMLGARLQVPAEAHDKMPAVIMMHGTGGIRYSGVYYAAALNGAGIATLEVDQWAAAACRAALPAVPLTSTITLAISPAPIAC